MKQMTRIRTIGAAVLLLILSSAAVMAQTAPGVMDVGTLIRQESDLSQLPMLHNWTSNLQSSYDRTGSNGDAQQFL